MKVLILHQHFNTPEKGGAIRSYYLAKALKKKGIEVVVITGHNEKHHQKQNIEGIEVHYLPVAYNNRFGFTARSTSFLKYVFCAIKKSRTIKEVDLCYAISAPLTVGLAALWCKFWYRIPFIFEVGDLWPDAPIEMGFVKNPALKWILFQLEKSIYRESKSIVALSLPIQKRIEEKVRGKKIYLIPNMADTDFYKPESKNKTLEQKFGVEEKFVVSYIGALGAANGLDYFLECARASQKAALPIQFLMCGAGAMERSLQQSAKLLNLNNFSFIPFQNRDGVREVMNITDAVFVSYKSIPILETGSPNKYFDGLASGKLLVINFGGWIKEEIEKHVCGIHVDPKHPTDFVGKISQFISRDQSFDAYRTRARDLAIKMYSRKILAEQFSDIFLNA